MSYRRNNVSPAGADFDECILKVLDIYIKYHCAYVVEVSFAFKSAVRGQVRLRGRKRAGAGVQGGPEDNVGQQN